MMDLTKILAVSGKPGLYRMLSQTKTGFIVESLIDGKRFPVFAHERVSSLEEISIFTTGEEDMQLKEVFKKMFEKTEGHPGPGSKAGQDEVIRFFGEAIPDYDPEKVYISDMRKAVTWYNTLLEKNMLDFTEEEGESPAEAPDKDEAKDAGEKAPE